MSDVWLYPLGLALGAEAVQAQELTEEFGPVREDFLSRTGFKTLYRATPEQTGLNLAIEAIGAADKSWWAEKVDALIYVSSTGDLVAPGNAHLLQTALDLPKEMLVFDMNDACTGFVKSLHLASTLLNSGSVQTVLLVLSDTYSKLYDPSNLRVSPLFSDGASAMILSSQRIEAAPADAAVRRWQVLATNFISEGSHSSELTISRGDAEKPFGSLFMNGAGVLNFVLKHLGSTLSSLLATAKLDRSDVQRWYVHQGSSTVVKSVEKAVGSEPGALFRSADYGNTVGSSLPFQIFEDTNEADSNQVIGLLAFGVGLTMAGMLVRQVPASPQS